MMANEDYDALTETDDPDVAFLVGSDILEIRSSGPATRGKSSSQTERRPRRPRRPSRCCAPWLWILLLLVLTGVLILSLGLILYRRSREELPNHTYSGNIEQSTTPADGSSSGQFEVATSTDEPGNSKTSLIDQPVTIDRSACHYQRIRLPGAVKPSAYNLEMEVLNISDGHFSGNVKIELTVTEPTSLIVLHSKNLTLFSQKMRLVTVSESEGEGTILLNGIQECLILEQVQISTRKLLQPGAAYRLEISFSGTLRDDMNGFYRSDYSDVAGKKVFLATTQFETTHARSAFPCFDEPAMKAVFRMRLTHEDRLLSLSNSPVKSHTTAYQRKGFTVTEFEETPSMSTYLVAFIICDFERKAPVMTNDGVEVSIYAVRHKLNQTELALKTCVSVLKFYEEFFGIKYPLKKLDLVAVPDFSAGAMENWGLITFRESALLYDPEESPLTQLDFVSVVVAHEMAHQWFGNLVTMTWWDQLWLNEGFASFMEYLGSDAAHPHLQMWRRISSDMVQTALHKDALTNTHAIVADVEDPAEISSRFDDISYLKGGSVLLMLYKSLGPDVFRTGVTAYLNSHSFSNAKTEDLWTALNSIWQSKGIPGTRSVKEIADSWISQPGFPLITTIRKNGQVDVVQEKLIPMAEKDPAGPTWIVPISYFDASRKNTTKYWLDRPNGVLMLADSSASWYKLNSGQTSFFRTNYDKANWEALTVALKTNPGVFLPEDRANLLDDAFSLARAGKLNMTVALNLASYLSKEEDDLPWTSASAYLASTESLLFETESFPKFRQWRRQLVQPVFNRSTCLDVPSEKISDRRLCIALFNEACDADLPACIAQARSLYRENAVNGKKIPVDLRLVVYGTVVRHGDEELWDRLWGLYRATQVASEKNILMIALARTQNAWLIDRYLRYAFNSDLVRPSNTVSILSALSTNYAARTAVWRTVRQNWNLLMKRYGNDTPIASVLTALNWMTSRQDLQELRAFFHQPARRMGAGLMALNQTIETIQLRRRFLDLYSSEISQWLASQSL